MNDYKALNQRRLKYDEVFRVDDHNFFMYSQVAAELQYSIDGVLWKKADDVVADSLTPVKNCPVHALYKVHTTSSFTPQSRLNDLITYNEYGEPQIDPAPVPGDADYSDEVLICQ